MPQRVLRLNNFNVGLTDNDRSRQVGHLLVAEEVDIFNPGYIQPETIFTTDAGIARKITGYTLADDDDAYAIGVSADGDAEVWKLVDASVDNPGSWASFFESANDAHANNNIIWHKLDDGTENVYYTTISSTTVTLRSLAIAGPTEGSVGTLTGLDGTRDRIPMIKASGELFIGNGQHISKVDDDGVFTEKAFTLPNGVECVDMTTIGDELAILTRLVNKGINVSQMYFWDKTALTGFNDVANIPMGDPQIVVNQNETLKVLCAKNGILKIFEMVGLLPNEIHRVQNVDSETNAIPVIPTQSKFVRDGILYFGLNATKSGLYALGKKNELILNRRFDTSDYSLHTAYAAASFGPNWFVAFDDNGSADFGRIEGNNSPTRSSNAVIETVLYDFGDTELKDLTSFEVLTKNAIPDSTSLDIYFKPDNGSYDTAVNLTNANDQNETGTTANTYWFRNTTTTVGRLIQMKIEFNSSTTSRIQLYEVILTANARE